MKIKRIDKKEFLERLKGRKYENIKLVKMTEDFFLKKRRYVFKMPPKGSPVILLVSGGLDSIVSWNILMEEFKLKVYPIFIKTGQKRNKGEWRSLIYFSNFFKKRYPRLWIKPFSITYHSSAPEIRHILKNLHKYVHPNVATKNFCKKSNSVVIKRKYLFPALIPFIGSLTTLIFELCDDLKIRTIFSSTLPSDGLYNSSQSFTSLRAAMLALSIFYYDFSWQYGSVNFEKECGLWLDKVDLVKLGSEYGLPLEKTYSCFKGGRYNCGSCLACSVRRRSFQKAGVEDRTIYENMSLGASLTSKMRRFLSPFFLIRLFKKVLIKLRMKKINSISSKIIIKDYY